MLGEEAGLILQRRFELEVEDEVWNLVEGDSFRFTSRCSHRYRNPDAIETTRVLWSIYTPKAAQEFLERPRRTLEHNLERLFSVQRPPYAVPSRKTLIMHAVPPLPDIASLWQDTVPSRPTFDILAGDRQYDVAIIGGGYTGLTAARAVAARGLAPVVLEASRIGWGASGRNGGVVAGKFRLAYSDIAAKHGLDVARRMHDLGDEAVDCVADLVDTYGIAAADYRPTGTLRCAHNEASFATLRREVEWLRSALGDTACSILTSDEVARETSSIGFHGGLLNRKGGIIHPLNYVFGLADGIRKAGATIAERTPVVQLRRQGGGFVLETPHGVVRAPKAIIATNGYSDLTAATRAVCKSIIPFRSAMLVTEPLTGTPAQGLLATDRSYSETRRMMRWFRKVGDRLVYGGRGAFGRTDRDSAFAALRTAMDKQFPELIGVAVTHRWSGLVAMTMDAVPHVGRVDDRLTYAMGYNGAGVAMASLMGRYAADYVLGESPDLGLMSSRPLNPIPMHSLREPAVRAVAGWYQFLDRIGR